VVRSASSKRSETLGGAGTLVMPSGTDGDDLPFDAAHTPAARDLGRVATENLERDPLVFLHRAGSGCTQRDEAHRSVPAL
jgi:hypothetical protein